MDNPKIHLINFNERILGETIKNLIIKLLIKYKKGKNKNEPLLKKSLKNL